MTHTGMRWVLMLVSVVAGLSLTAEAQSMPATKLNIPFAFEVNGELMPAGTYILRLADRTGTMNFACTTCMSSVFTVWRPTGENVRTQEVRLTFVQAGNRYHLKRGSVPGWSANWSSSLHEIEMQAGDRQLPEIFVASR
jgi:hypothetical protein